MVKRYNRLLAVAHVAVDATAGMLAFMAAYWVRFHSGLIGVTKGVPPVEQYLWVTPLLGLLVPLAFQLHGVYRLRRGRSRIDDFFGVLVGSVLAVVLGVVTTLYVQTYYIPDPLKDRGVFEVSQLVWGIFLIFNVALTFSARVAVRDWLERRWRAGIGLKKVLVAGAGDLGRLVVDKILEHRELGLKVVGFVDDRADSGRRWPSAPRPPRRRRAWPPVRRRAARSRQVRRSSSSTRTPRSSSSGRARASHAPDRWWWPSSPTPTTSRCLRQARS